MNSLKRLLNDDQKNKVEYTRRIKMKITSCPESTLYIRFDGNNKKEYLNLLLKLYAHLSHVRSFNLNFYIFCWSKLVMYKRPIVCHYLFISGAFFDGIFHLIHCSKHLFFLRRKSNV